MKMLLVLLAASLLSGCASIFSDSRYPVSVTSSPPGASFEVKDKHGKTVYNGTTPATVKLDSGAGYFSGAEYTFTFRKDGYNEQSSFIDSGIDGWYWPNILIGGVIGMLIVDPLTGAMYDLPSNTSATLSLAAPPPQPVSSNYGASSSPVSRSIDEQIYELQQRNLPYEQYQQEYRRIMGQ